MSTPAPAVRRNCIAFVCGMKGSGKSRLLYRHFIARAPRTISIDPNDEAAENCEAAGMRPPLRVYGMAELLPALRYCVEHGNRWHISAALEREEIPRLFRMLAPPMNSREVKSFSRSVGGIAIECGEAYTVAPNTGGNSDVLEAWARGRHHCLSLLMATQRPAQCSRIISSQADYFIAFRQHEPNDVNYIKRTISAPVAEIVALLPDRHFVHYTQADGRVRVCDERYRVYRTLTPAGQEVA